MTVLCWLKLRNLNLTKDQPENGTTIVPKRVAGIIT